MMFNMQICLQNERMSRWLLVSSLDVSPISFPFFFVASPLLGFRSQLVVFYSTLMGVFERILGLGSLECPEAPFNHRHVVLPIFSGGIRFISLEAIAPAIYLGSWALVTFVIASRFLLHAIGANGLGPFPF
jgi:hypothetical protein